MIVNYSSRVIILSIFKSGTTLYDRRAFIRLTTESFPKKSSSFFKTFTELNVETFIAKKTSQFGKGFSAAACFCCSVNMQIHISDKLIWKRERKREKGLFNANVCLGTSSSCLHTTRSTANSAAVAL